MNCQALNFMKASGPFSLLALPVQPRVWINRRGVMPVIFLKTRPIWLWLENPQSRAIRANDCPVDGALLMRFFTSSILSSSKY